MRTTRTRRRSIDGDDVVEGRESHDGTTPGRRMTQGIRRRESRVRNGEVPTDFDEALR